MSPKLIPVIALLLSLPGRAVACDATVPARSWDEIIEDAATTTRVRAVLLELPAVAVRTCSGRVRLSGSVRSQRQAEQALDLARGVVGALRVSMDVEQRAGS